MNLDRERCRGVLWMCVLASPAFSLAQLHFLSTSTTGKEWHQVNNTLDYTEFLEVERAEALMWGPEMLRELSQVTGGDWLTEVGLQLTPSSYKLLPPHCELEKSILLGKALEKYPGPKESTFQVQVSSRNYFLTLALKWVLRWLFSRVQWARQLCQKTKTQTKTKNSCLIKALP